MASETLVELYRFDEDGETFDTICTLVYPEPQTCYIKGLASLLKIEHARELRDYLKERGITTLLFKRRGRWRSYPLEASA